MDILNLLIAGYTIDKIPKEYPKITKKDVLVVIEFTGQLAEKPTQSLKLTKSQPSRKNPRLAQIRHPLRKLFLRYVDV